MKTPIKRPERIPGTEEHHVWGGAWRKWSEKYNCVIYLPRELHTGTNGIHRNRAFREKVQAEYEDRLIAAGWTDDEIREVFGKLVWRADTSFF